MKRVILIATALLFVVVAVLTTRVAAQDTNTQERSFLTFSGPVELPGVTLPAGTYVFRLADTPSRNVVQVLSRDEKDIKGQWTFVQAERPEVSQDTVIMFKEAREGSTPAVQFWYYPGEKIGKEFIYPKDQAQKIADRTGVGVLSESGRVASSNSTVTSTNAQGEVNSLPREKAAPKPEPDAAIAGVSAGNADQSASSTQRNAPAASQPTAAAGSTAGNRGVSPPPESQVAAAQQPAPAPAPAPRAVGTSGRSNELPKTASPVPLSGLIGLLSLVGAMGARAASARR